MNRIRSRTLLNQPFSSEASFNQMDLAGDLAATSGAAIQVGLAQSGLTSPSYALFTPLHYEPNYAYPLLIWLHGADDDENQLKRIMPQISLRNYVAIAPRGTAPVSTLESNSFTWRQTEGHIAAAEQRALECLAVATEKFHVAPNRVFLAGQGCGGTMAFRVAMRHPRLFAGVVSCGGPFPSGHAPLAQLHSIRRLSVFVGCNRQSLSYPTELVCDDLRLLHSAGMSIMLREYPGSDDLSPLLLSDVDRWLMEQITAASATAPEAASSSK